MNEKIKKIIEKVNSTKIYLILANILLVFFLILLTNFNVLPFKGLGDFTFFAILALILALYRPGWGFLFFVGTIALENINLAPESIGFNIRPFQFFGGLTVLAIIIRLILKRLNFELIYLKWQDWLVALIVFSGSVSSFFAEDKVMALKLSVILGSFLLLYLLIRNYIQNVDDLKKVIPFFLSSAAAVIFYGIWQNIRFSKGLSNFEAMPGRPNGTFTEADWLGMFLVFLLAIIYALLFHLKNEKYVAGLEEVKGFCRRVCSFELKNFRFIFLYLFLVFIFTALILTVSRSAWLGAIAVTAVLLTIVLSRATLKIKQWQWSRMLNKLSVVIITFLVAMVYVKAFNLTDFQLINRAQSTGTGLQKITIACSEEVELPEKISDVSELANYNCQHINLEEINSEQEAGKVVMEVYRDDPNVNIRAEIYKKSWEEIKKSPILGIGWGNIGKILGNDGRGVGLNSSNIFLQVWLGSGIAGLLAFTALWLYILAGSIRLFLKEDKTAGVFILLGTLALLIPNMFNAGLFLGLLWVFLGVSVSLINANRN